MKTKTLIELVDTRPIIVFKLSDCHDADPGMLGRLVGYKLDDYGSENSTSLSFQIDMSEFVDYNKSLAQPNWFDKNGDPTLRWHETAMYPSNNVEDAFEMLYDNGVESEVESFELHEPHYLITEFTQQSVFKSYVLFLEDRLNTLLKEKTLTN